MNSECLQDEKRKVEKIIAEELNKFCKKTGLYITELKIENVSSKSELKYRADIRAIL